MHPDKVIPWGSEGLEIIHVTVTKHFVVHKIAHLLAGKTVNIYKYVFQLSDYLFAWRSIVNSDSSNVSSAVTYTS